MYYVCYLYLWLFAFNVLDLLLLNKLYILIRFQLAEQTRPRSLIHSCPPKTKPPRNTDHTTPVPTAIANKMRKRPLARVCITIHNRSMAINIRTTTMWPPAQTHTNTLLCEFIEAVCTYVNTHTHVRVPSMCTCLLLLQRCIRARVMSASASASGCAFAWRACTFLPPTRLFAAVELVT